MKDRQHLVLAAVLRCAAPLVRLLVRNGVTYPALSAALKPVFVEAAERELATQAMKRTDSAVTLLSGVHRKDVRDIQTTGAEARAGGQNRGVARSARAAAPPPTLSVVGQVVAAWQSARPWRHAGKPRVLPRTGTELSFDALVKSVTQDVRPRAMLAEMLRLGVVRESPQGEVRESPQGAARDSPQGLVLHAAGFVPRAGFDAMSEAMALNLQDHAAAAAANLHDDARWLEQAVYVDDVSAESVEHLHGVARQAWQVAFESVMAAAQQRFDHDAAHVPAPLRTHRARFGVYFYGDPTAPSLASSAAAPAPPPPTRPEEP